MAWFWKQEEVSSPIWEEGNISELETAWINSDYTPITSEIIEDFWDAFYFSELWEWDEANSLWQQLYDTLIAQWYDTSTIIWYKTVFWSIVLLFQDSTTLTVSYDSTHWIILGWESETAVLESERERVQEKIESLSSKLRQVERVLDTMDDIFWHNEQEFWQEIGEEDAVTISPNEFPWNEIPWLEWKTTLHLIELQPVARTLLQEISAIHSEIPEHSRQGWFFTSYSQAQERYLDFTLGIGDRYEWGARAFHSYEDGTENVSETEIETMLSELIASRNTPEIFAYMFQKHSEIEANNHQSAEVSRTYEIWKRICNREFLKKLKAENAPIEHFLIYAKMVSGREAPEASEILGQDIPQAAWNSLDTWLLDPASATEALLFAFQKEDGIFEKLSQHISITDPLLEELPESEKSPRFIIDSCISQIEQKVEWMSDVWSGRWILFDAWFWNIIDISSDKKYSELNLEEKMQVSILLRLVKLMEQDKGITIEEFQYYFIGIAQNASQIFNSFFSDSAGEGWQVDIIWALNDAIDGGFMWYNSITSETLGIIWIEAELYNLYRDIQGVWIFDISDANFEIMRWVSQFWAILVGSIALAMIALPAAAWVWLISTGLAASNAMFITTASLASVWVARAVMPEWYDSTSEMALDVVTDIVTAVWFWLLWSIFTRSSYAAFQSAGGQWTSLAGVKHLWVNAVDIGIFWIVAELARNFALRTPEMFGEDFSIQTTNRFSYEQFHNYVRLNISSFLPQ